MPNITRRKRITSRTEIGPYKRHELLTGEIVYPVLGYAGYGDGTGTDLSNFISEEMRHDWQANRDELIAFWHSGEHTMEVPWLFVRGGPGMSPWAAEQFDVKKQRAQ